MRMLHVLLLIAACSTTPADEVRAALADVVMLPEGERATTRYLTLYNVPLKERETTAAVVSYLLNAVSRTVTVVRPTEVDEELRLMRFDLCAYGLSTEQWEVLADSGEPYFHLTAQGAAPATGVANTQAPAIPKAPAAQPGSNKGAEPVGKVIH